MRRLKHTSLSPYPDCLEVCELTDRSLVRLADVEKSIRRLQANVHRIHNPHLHPLHLLTPSRDAIASTAHRAKLDREALLLGLDLARLLDERAAEAAPRDEEVRRLVLDLVALRRGRRAGVSCCPSGPAALARQMLTRSRSLQAVLVSKAPLRERPEKRTGAACRRRSKGTRSRPTGRTCSSRRSRRRLRGSPLCQPHVRTELGLCSPPFGTGI